MMMCRVAGTIALALALWGSPVVAAAPERELNGFGVAQFGMTRAEVLGRLDGRVLADGEGLRGRQPLDMGGAPLDVHYDFGRDDRLHRVRLEHVGNIDFLNCLGNFQRYLQILTVRHGRAHYVLSETDAGLHAWRGIFIFANGAGAHLNTNFQGPDRCETGIFFLSPQFDQQHVRQ